MDVKIDFTTIEAVHGLCQFAFLHALGTVLFNSVSQTSTRNKILVLSIPTLNQELT